MTQGAEFGFIDIPSLVAAGGAGAPIRIVAANYQKPPYCIFSLNPGANIDSAKKLAGLEARLQLWASFLPRIWAAVMGTERRRFQDNEGGQYRCAGAGADAGGPQGALDRCCPS